VAYTHSDRARQLLALWEDVAPKFVKVMPTDYQRMLDAIQDAEKDGQIGEAAIMAAFEANKNDGARVSGN
jgi:glutamate synthase domain-containing protein 3